MQKQHNNTFLKTILMIGMVFCVVFASTLKTVFDDLSDAEKTSQVLEEKQPDNEKENDSNEKELFSKFINNTENLQKKESKTNKLLIHQALFILTKPFFKVQIPPPDISFS